MSKRWVPDEEATNCPICDRPFESSLKSFTATGRTHCRLCGGVYCNACCHKELLIPEDEVVRPPPGETLKSLIFDALAPQKVCARCAGILEPKQRQVKNDRNKHPSQRRASWVESDPYFSSMCDVKRKPMTNTFISLTVCDSVAKTSPAHDTTVPAWGETFHFSVGEGSGTPQAAMLLVESFEEGKILGNELLGQAVVPLEETDKAGAWITLEDELKQSLTGQVLLRISYHGGSNAIQEAAAAAAHNAKAAQAARSASAYTILLAFLQDNAWVIYTAFLVATIAYKFTVLVGFGGDEITMRAGMMIGNGRWLSSKTHCLHMRKDGNLVLTTGNTPKANGVLEWQSGRPFRGRDCPKCIAMLDRDGNLVVKEGKAVLKSFNIDSDSWLNGAINVKGRK